MVSSQGPVWWSEVLTELRSEPLVRVCQRRQLAVEEVLVQLVAGGDDGPVNEQPWWPEAVRIAERQGLRRAARLFSSNPRRLRRGLARQGVRLAGKSLDEVKGGLSPELMSRLGKEPDHQIAREAGLIPQAVAGLRRAAGIPAFRPVPRPRPRPVAATPVATTPVVKPADTVATKPVVAAPVTLVTPAAPPAAPAPVTSAGAAVGSEAREPRRVAVRVPGGGTQATPRPRPVEAAEPARPVDPRARVWSRRNEEVAPPPVDARALREVLSRPVVPEEQESEAVAAARAARRSGMVRIVRPDVVDVKEPEVRQPVRRVVRTRAEPRHGQVREISPMIMPEVLIEAPAPRPASGLGLRPTAEASPPVRPATVAPRPEPKPEIVQAPVRSPVEEPVAESVAAPVNPPVVAPVSLAPAAAEPDAAEAAPAPAAPAPAAPAPAAPAPAPAAPVQLILPVLVAEAAPTLPAPKLPAPKLPALSRPAAPAATSKAPAPRPASGPKLGWEVRIGDRVLPYLVVAPDIGVASAEIMALLGAPDLAGASIRLLGPVIDAR